MLKANVPELLELLAHVDVKLPDGEKHKRPRYPFITDIAVSVSAGGRLVSDDDSPSLAEMAKKCPPVRNASGWVQLEEPIAFGETVVRRYYHQAKGIYARIDCIDGTAFKIDLEN